MTPDKIYALEKLNQFHQSKIDKLDRAGAFRKDINMKHQRGLKTEKCLKAHEEAATQRSNMLINLAQKLGSTMLRFLALDGKSRPRQ